MAERKPKKVLLGSVPATTVESIDFRHVPPSIVARNSGILESPVDPAHGHGPCDTPQDVVIRSIRYHRRRR
jgi:hypothetical protein